MNAGGALSFGTVLRHYRRAANLTQAALAKRAGLSERAVNDLERDSARQPRRETVDLLAEALALPPPERTALLTAAQRPDPLLPATPVLEGAAPGAAPVIPLAGRAREQALLEYHLRREGPPVLLLAGEPGIGKTRLLQETMQSANELGWQVVYGGCLRREDQEPYAPLAGALAHALVRIPRSHRPAALRGCDWLVYLLPELGADGALAESLEPCPVGSLPPEQARRRIFQAVTRFLANLAGERGIVLVLDDLQWAGADALAMLAAIGHAAAPAAGGSTTILRVVGAYRDTELPLDGPLSATLADLAHAGMVTHHALAPLTAQETLQLLDAFLWHRMEMAAAPLATIDAPLKEQLVQRTGGVPFFVLSCAQVLADTGRLVVPWTVAHSIRQRVATLPEEIQVVLSAAAVVGRAVPVDLLARVVASPHKEVLDALDAGFRARLLADDGVGGYRFSYDIMREVLETDLTSARRALLQRLVGEALGETTPWPEEALA